MMADVPFRIESESETTSPVCWGDAVHGCWFEVERFLAASGCTVRLHFYQRDEETGERREVGCRSFPTASDDLEEVAEDAVSAGLIWLSFALLFQERTGSNRGPV